MKLVIVTPVFNDWESFARLTSDIDLVMQDQEIEYLILAVNDDSSIMPGDIQVKVACRILHLTCNLGHQRAIAVGLAHLADSEDFDAIVVMDADGEDKPEYLPGLIAQHLANPRSIIVARRDKRSEGNTFKLGYRLYQFIFGLFTGKKLPFGNFCLLPQEAAKRLVYQESIWNHLAATVLRSRFDLVMLPTERGNRYAGESSMNLGSLVLFGLSAISVYSDIALVRTLFASFVLSLGAVATITVTTFWKLFTDMATPGWASTVVGSMLIIVLQCLVVSVSLLFIILSNRSQRGFVVARNYSDYVLEITDTQISP